MNQYRMASIYASQNAGGSAGGATLPIAESDVTSLVADLALKAPKANPTFTGTVTIPNGSGATDAAAFGQIPTAGGIASAGYAKTVIRTGDSSTISSNASLASDDTLLWAVGASDRWFFQGMLTFTAADSSGASTTADVQLGWSVPTGGAMQWGVIGNLGSNFAGFGATASASSPLTVLTAASALAEGMVAGSVGLSIAGFYTGDGTHTGTVNLQWAQNTSNAATLLIAKNSALILWRLV